MATYSPITDDDGWFIGTDQPFSFHIKDEDGLPIDIGSFSMTWYVKYRANDLDTALLINKTATVTGTFNASATLNTQRARVEVADTDTDQMDSGTYYHELKRTDAGNERVLSYGPAVLKRAGHRT